MEPFAVTRSTSLPTSADEAWRSVLEGAWLGDDVALVARVGATGTIVEGDVVRRAVVTEVVDGAALRFVWWDESRPELVSTVDVRVEGDEQGSTVTVTEQVLGGAVALAAEASVADLGISEVTWDRRLRALVGDLALAPAAA